MTEEEAKKKQLLAAYAWGRHSAAAPECFALDPDKLVALCAMGVMPPKVEKGAGSTPATGSAGNGGNVGERPAATCVATTTNTMSGDECVRGDDSCVESDSCGVCDLKRSAQAAIAKAEGRS